MWQTLRRKILFWQHPATSHTELILDRRRVYIFPSKAGWVFGAIIVTIFIGSINFKINLGYALLFMLVSIGWLAIMMTFRNLIGLGLFASATQAVFAGEMAHFTIHLNNRSKRVRYSLQIGFDKTDLKNIDVDATSTQLLSLGIMSTQRGWLACPRIRIQTRYPFGLLTAWSFWRTHQRLMIYPAPEKNPPPLPIAIQATTTSYSDVHLRGKDDISGVRQYQFGDPLSQLAWRQMAKTEASGADTLLSKDFEGAQQQTCILDFAALPMHLNTEQKLARLCAWVLLAEQRQVKYGFRLGAITLPNNAGMTHQQTCLQSLALFNLPSVQDAIEPRST